MIIKFRYPASDNHIWTTEGVQSLIGQSFAAALETDIIGTGKVIDAVVADEGRAADLMVEWPDNPGNDKLLNDIKHISIEED